MKKRRLFQPVHFVILFFMTATSLYADGAFFSDRIEHLNEPEQKSIILWDGQKETMIVSAKVDSSNLEDLSKMAWLIPLDSKKKPEVNKSDIKVFEILVEHFRPPSVDFSFGVQGAASVKLLEFKEIDIYDVSILKATDTKELVEWFKENGFMVSAFAIPVIDEYIRNNIQYFILTRIDLSNKFGLDYKEAVFVAKYDSVHEDPFPTGMRPEFDSFVGRMRGVIDRSFMSDLPYYLNLTVELVRKSIIVSILTGIPFKDSVANTEICRILQFLSEKEYNKLLKTNVLGEGIYEKISLGDDSYWTASLLEDREGRKGRLDRIKPNIKNIKVDLSLDSRTGLLLHPDGKVIIGLGDKYMKIRELSMSSKEYAKFLEDNLYDIQEKYKAVSMALNYTKLEHLESVAKEIKKLSNGVALPLKIDFYPDKPVYPLFISSINKGSSNIEVYFCGSYIPYDSNGMLRFDRFIEVNESLKTEIKPYLDLGECKYITRLTYRGDLANLTNDAVLIGSLEET